MKNTDEDKQARVRKADESFSHGSAYPDENGKIRPEPCASCAFTQRPGNVREGTEVALADLEEAMADYDDFLCHCADKDGKVYTCAGWAARFAQDCIIPLKKEKQW